MDLFFLPPLHFSCSFSVFLFCQKQRIDVLLRKAILGMCLDIEHFLKVKLIKGAEDDPEEDGYTIVECFLKTEAGQQANSSIIQKKNNPYCGNLIKAYQDEMPIWAFEPPSSKTGQ